jgi:hypothetical protein
MAKAQAAFRDEPWDLTFEEYCFLWKDHWEDRGRQPDNVCMTRKDDEGPWDKHNTEIVTRKEHFQRTSLKRMSNIGHRKRGPDTKPRRVTRITCPHCGLESTVSRIKTWHMDNCKHKGE